MDLFAHKIRFSPGANRLGFTPAELVSKKYGELGDTGDQRVFPVPDAPPFRSSPTSMELENRGAWEVTDGNYEVNSYSITYEWLGKEKHLEKNEKTRRNAELARTTPLARWRLTDANAPLPHRSQTSLRCVSGERKGGGG